jgi:hypothetical protein
MKYTNYILNGNIVDIEGIIPKKRIFRQLTVLCLIPIAFFGIGVFSLMIPFTLLIDGYRSLKMQRYIYLKKYKEYTYYTEVFSELNATSIEKERLRFFLTSGKQYFMSSEINDYNDIPLLSKAQYILSKSTYFITNKHFKIKHSIDNKISEGLYKLVKPFSNLVIE